MSTHADRLKKNIALTEKVQALNLSEITAEQLALIHQEQMALLEGVSSEYREVRSVRDSEKRQNVAYGL